MDNNELKDFFEEMRNPNANLLLISENKLKKLENCKIEKEKLEESLNKMIVLNQNLMNEINNNHIVIKNLSNSIDILSNDIKIVNNELSILKNENINNKKEIKDVKDIANTTKIINENIEKLKNEIIEILRFSNIRLGINSIPSQNSLLIELKNKNLISGNHLGYIDSQRDCKSRFVVNMNVT